MTNPETAESRLDASRTRLQAIVDEAFGPEPELPMDDLLSTLEQHISAMLRKCASFTSTESERYSGTWVHAETRPTPTQLIGFVSDGLAHGLFGIDLRVDYVTAHRLIDSGDNESFMSHINGLVSAAADEWLSKWKPAPTKATQ